MCCATEQFQIQFTHAPSLLENSNGNAVIYLLSLQYRQVLSFEAHINSFKFLLSSYFECLLLYPFNKSSCRICVNRDLQSSDNMPPVSGHLGEYSSIHPCNAEKVCVLAIQTKDSTYNRSVDNIVKLPVDEDNMKDSGKQSSSGSLYSFCLDRPYQQYLHSIFVSDD